MKRILIIEDNPDIRMALEDDFEMEGYKVESAITGTEGLKKGQNLDYDIILLDLMLPGLGGMEICKELRRLGIGTPIIMLTAKSQDIDKVLGLEMGADDYVTKPFSPHELQARVKAVLRRSGNLYLDEKSSVYKSGPFLLDINKHQLTKNKELIQLTAIEFSLFRFFMKNKNHVLQRNEILDQVWGKEVYVTPRTVDTHVANLRKKIEDNPEDQQWILGIRGVGYTFVGD